MQRAAQFAFNVLKADVHNADTQKKERKKTFQNVSNKLALLYITIRQKKKKNDSVLQQ